MWCCSTYVNAGHHSLHCHYVHHNFSLSFAELYWHGEVVTVIITEAFISGKKKHLTGKRSIRFVRLELLKWTVDSYIYSLFFKSGTLYGAKSLMNKCMRSNRSVFYIATLPAKCGTNYIFYHAHGLKDVALPLNHVSYIVQSLF